MEVKLETIKPQLDTVEYSKWEGETLLSHGHLLSTPVTGKSISDLQTEAEADAGV